MEKKTNRDIKIIIAAIVGITLIEITALSMGRNGMMLITTIGAIAGLAGLALPTPKILRGN